jgi:hypothetical protein
MAAFATMLLEKFNVETFGIEGCDDGQVVRFACGPPDGGTTVNSRRISSLKCAASEWIFLLNL